MYVVGSSTHQSASRITKDVEKFPPLPPPPTLPPSQLSLAATPPAQPSPARAPHSTLARFTLSANDPDRTVMACSPHCFKTDRRRPGDPVRLGGYTPLPAWLGGLFSPFDHDCLPKSQRAQSVMARKKNFIKHRCITALHLEASRPERPKKPPRAMQCKKPRVSIILPQHSPYMPCFFTPPLSLLFLPAFLVSEAASVPAPCYPAQRWEDTSPSFPSQSPASWQTPSSAPTSRACPTTL